MSDVNRTPFHRSRGFEDSTKVGIGWLEDGADDNPEGEVVYSRYESWRNIIWDSAATEMDLSDARYIFRQKWVDVDIAQAHFRNRADLILASSSDLDDASFIDDFGDEAMDYAENEMQNVTEQSRADRTIGGFRRQRVRMLEAWFRSPKMVKRITGGPFAGEIYDPLSPGHTEAAEAGIASVVERQTMLMRVAIMTTKGMLYFGSSPYRHNKFPFTPIFGYRRGRDGLPYGMIRGLRGIQEDINKRASKALHILSTNKIIADEGAVEDVNELIEEAARPDAVIFKKKGFELRLDNERDLSQWHLEFMSRDISLIQQASGVTDELLGRRTNATSGVAIGKRQEQGGLATSKFFDNLRFAVQCQGEKQLSLVEQFVSEKKAFRITNMRGTPEFIEVNDGLPDNDIVRSKADYVITDADWRASMRQAAADELLEVLTRLPPEVAIVVLDLAVENMDLPNREEIVRRIRSVTGQRDPDAEGPTEEEVARIQAQQQMQEIQTKKLLAEVSKLLSEADKNTAQARSAIATSIKTNIQAMGGPKRGAIDIVADTITKPEIIDASDHVLHETGFVSRSEQEFNEAVKAAELEQQPPPGIRPAG